MKLSFSAEYASKVLIPPAAMVLFKAEYLWISSYIQFRPLIVILYNFNLFIKLHFSTALNLQSVPTMQQYYKLVPFLLYYLYHGLMQAESRSHKQSDRLSVILRQGGTASLITGFMDPCILP
ncbi:MAG: hypothetical protein GX200_05395 [Firmicutes bacterium]|nr:hypothetical protein [Bacillota bacterium]